MTAPSAARRVAGQQSPAQAPVVVLDAGSGSIRPCFQRPANDNRMPLAKLIAEWSPLLMVGSIIAAGAWWVIG